MKQTMRILIFLLWAFVIATALMAQEQGQPAANPDDNGGEALQQTTDDQTPAFTPDDRPLTGGQVIGTGSRGPQHSFFVPGFRVSQIVDSNPDMSTDSHYRGFTSLNGD